MTSPVLLFLIERGQNLEPNKQELFLRLLEQIKWQHLPEEQELFTGAAIDKVEVHTASKRWEFVINQKTTRLNSCH